MAAEVKKIVVNQVNPLPNSDKLCITYVDNIPCILSKQFAESDKEFIYFSQNTILPEIIFKEVFKDREYSAKTARIKAMKLRGTFSEGLLIPYSKIKSLFPNLKEKNLFEELGCKNYYPLEDTEEQQKVPVKKTWFQSVCSKIAKKINDVTIPEYADTERIEKANMDLKQHYAMTVKMYGISARYSLPPKTYWNLLFPRKLVIGSKRVINPKLTLYSEVAKKINLEAKMLQIEQLLGVNGVKIFGEIVGPGIQGDFKYTEVKTLFIYGIYVDGKYLSYQEMFKICEEVDLRIVPFLGTFLITDKENLPAYLESWCDRKLHPHPVDIAEPCREGIVLHFWSKDDQCPIGKRHVYKYISESFRQR